MNDKALIVIDVQESFRHRDYWSNDGVSEFVRNVQQLIDGCMEKKIPVVQVLHSEKEGPFDPATGWVTTLDPIRIQPDAVFYKHYHSALAGTSLAEWLKEKGIRKVIVSGIRTEQCCETTTRHASDSGFEVDFVTEATLTFPMKQKRTGRVFSAEEIKERTELVLENRFANIKTVEEILKTL